MPIYEFNCEGCGDFTVARVMDRRNDPCACPSCGATADRVVLSTPAFSSMPAQLRGAHATNERARHAPVSSAEWASQRRHGPGCGCCGGGSRPGTLRSPSGAKAFPAKRPWMISH
ncbi:MAG: zinc ribbon domain-containing protein [Gemmatimonadales bacterium]|nr:zinc ribbon domain-containing protein [Gemmatimonadales bacterium]